MLGLVRETITMQLGAGDGWYIFYYLDYGNLRNMLSFEASCLRMSYI